MSPRLEFAVETAVKAGRFTLGLFNVGTPIRLKDDRSPVTAADLGAEKLIRAALADSFPGEAILGEEEGATGQGRDRWVIDPIDGTKSFICGVPLYATLLSYEKDGEPVVGVAYFPALDELVFAEKGKGAFWNGRPARVSERKTLEGAVLACGSHKGFAQTDRNEGIQNLAQKVMATRSWCDAYGHMLVATGRVDGMIDPIVNRYDVSAVELIVREAGGRCTAFDESEQPQNEAISSNGHIHGELVKAFQR